MISLFRPSSPPLFQHSSIHPDSLLREAVEKRAAFIVPAETPEQARIIVLLPDRQPVLTFDIWKEACEISGYPDLVRATLLRRLIVEDLAGTQVVEWLRDDQEDAILAPFWSHVLVSRARAQAVRFVLHWVYGPFSGQGIWNAVASSISPELVELESEHIYAGVLAMHGGHS